MFSRCTNENTGMKTNHAGMQKRVAARLQAATP